VPADRLELAREAYGAYVEDDRARLEQLLAPDLAFYSPADPGIDRATYFKRCWPNSETLTAFEFDRLVEIGGDEVLVTYECTKTDGRRFRNTEVLRFVGDRISHVEVYFGWDLPQLDQPG
jgi:ketosteroid isomerase-like protein